LELDHRDGHWLVTTSLTIHARETPNPHSRLYLADRPLSDAGRVFTCVRDDSPRLVRRLLERDDVLVVLARDHTLTVERTPGAAWPHIDAAVRDAVQSHWLGCGGVLPAAPRQPAHDPLLAAVWEVLETHVLDGIRRDGGDLELIDVEDGIAYVRLVGACRTCAAATQTLRNGVEGTLKRYFPHEIREVRTVDAA
jgi:Fe-S cluster biogenesis protein NfuA